MAQRRCLQTLSRRAIAALSNPTSLNQTFKSTLPSIAKSFPFRSSLVFTNTTHDHHLHYHTLRSYHDCRNFSSNSGDGSEIDEEETAEAEDSDDEVANDYDSKEKKSPEEDAEAIGYKVIGPLGENERVIKPYEPVFAVVQIGSHQFKVSNGDSIFTERLKFCDVNDKLILNKVLLLGSETQTIVGRPMVPDAVVHAIVEEHALDAKVIIFKKKRRKNYRRTKGHRQELTKLRITDIQGIEKPEMKLDKKPRKIVVKKQEKVPVAAS